MPTTKFLSKEVLVDSSLVRLILDILALTNIGLSMAILAGGTVRFSFPSYRPLSDFVNGYIWIWAIWIAFSAILMIIPFKISNLIGLWLSMFWHIVWTSAFVVAVISYPTAIATGIALHGGLALISAALLLAKALLYSDG